MASLCHGKVHGSNAQNNPDETTSTPLKRLSFQTVLGMTVESDTFFELRSQAKNDNQRRTLFKKRIRLLVNAGLCKVTNDAQIKMYWKHYEERIINRHGVVLEGWPDKIAFSPDNLGQKELEVVLATLLCGKCAWRKLDDAEHQLRAEEYVKRFANGEIERQKRKKRSDAGKKRKAAAVTDSTSPGADSSETNTNTDINANAANDSGSAERKPRKKPRRGRNVSSECVECVEDVEDVENEYEEED